MMFYKATLSVSWKNTFMVDKILFTLMKIQYIGKRSSSKFSF